MLQDYSFPLVGVKMTDKDKQAWYRDTDWLHETFWRWETYGQPSPEWNHEHCVFCNRRIAEAGGSDPETIHEAWTTTYADSDGDTGYEWVCPSCFDQLQDTFAWRVIKPREPAI